MSILMPQIASRLFNTPLMIMPDKAAAILMGLGARLVDGGLVLSPEFSGHISQPNMGVLGDRLGRSYDRQGARPYDVFQGVAVIGVEGTLVNKGAYIGQSSGQTSYQGLQAQIARAHTDDEIKGAAFEIDSPGGAVSGVFETAKMLADLSKKKPTMAILTDVGASSAYLLASACRQIVIPRTGIAGSIGVMSMHLDLSKKLENEGVTVTLITAGERKGDFHPAKPLAAEALERATASNEKVRQLFAETVGRHRGSRFTKAQALATEAAVFDGEDAVKAGLVDVVGSPNDAFAAFVRAVNKAA